MQRILIIGCPGAGKSTFARHLRDRTGLPLHYMDQLFWNADGTHVERDTLVSRIQSILPEPQWIIDGNYSGTLALRLAACDTVFLLDYPLDTCLDGVRARQGKPREDLPWQENGLSPEFEDYIRDFHATQLPELYALLSEYPEINKIIFHSYEDAEQYLKGLS